METPESTMTALPSTDARFLVVPFDIHRGDPDRFSVILDFLCAHPDWVTVPCSETDRRTLFAMVLTDPKNRIREVWDGSELVGLLYLGEIKPLISGVVHWTFLDRELRGKQELLQTWFGDCFAHWDFQSLVVQVPEHVETLLHYVRAKLGFKFHGQDSVKGHPALASLGMENPEVWVAKQGSRRERSHWYEKDRHWSDVYTLRLLRSEYEARHMKP